MADRTSGISRRNLLKGAVAAGGVVWAAPSILTQVASAQTACPGPGSCPNTFMVKLDPNQNVKEPQPYGAGVDTCTSMHGTAPGSGGNFCTSTPSIGTVQPFNCANRNSFFVASGNTDGATVTLTPQSGCRFISASVKKGSNNPCSSANISADCKTATFGPNSHIEFSFCCP